MDILDNYESSALAHPVDKKGSSKIQRRLDSIHNSINMGLYGKTSGTTGTNIFDMMKKRGGGNGI
jgi:hypothetical protein